MDMEDGIETNSSPLLGIGRQGYGLISGDQASSSHCTGNVSSEIRVEEGGYWQGANSSSHDPWRSYSGEPCQMQGVPEFQRAKRQNCSGLIQSSWNAVDGVSASPDETNCGPRRTNMEVEGTLGQSCRPGVAGFSSEDQGLSNTNASFDFLRTSFAVPGSSSTSSSGFLSNWVTSVNNSGEILPATGATLVENKVGSWSGVTDLHSTGLRLGDMGSAMACNLEGLSFEESMPGNLAVHSAEESLGTGFIMGCENTEVQATPHGNASEHSGPVEALYLCANANQCPNDTGGGCGLAESMCAYSSASPGTEGGATPFAVGGLMNNMAGSSDGGRLAHIRSGRRGPCKRKMSAAGIMGPLSLRDPQSSGRGDSIFTNSIGGPGSSGLDLGNSNCGVGGADIFQAACSAPMIHIWDEPHNLRSGLVSNESENATESTRGVGGKTLPLSATVGSSQRNVRCRPVTMQQDQSMSPLNPPFPRNTRRFLPASQSHGWSRRVPPAEEPLEPGANGVSIMTNGPEPEWPASAFSQRNGTYSVVANWGGSNSFPRGGSNYSRFVATSRDRLSGMFEGNGIGSLSTGVPNWLGPAAMDSRLLNQTGSESVSRVATTSATRPINNPENFSRSSQAGGSSLIHPVPTSWSASHLSSISSNRRNPVSSLGHMLPPPSSNSSIHPGPSSLTASLEVVPSSAPLYHGPCPTAVRPSLLVEGHGEGILMSPVQSLLGMPFRGLQLLPPDGENRHRFVSEILSALEHARRSQDLSFEELVMLDPSVIFGGIDVHDQHSDMRLDVDNMSYEELLALEERIGNVSTGLNEETMVKCLRTSKYSSLDATVAALSQECEIKCSICQEEYVEEDELSRLDCGHGYHMACIKQWLVQKNQCPICKAAAYSKS